MLKNKSLSIILALAAGVEISDVSASEPSKTPSNSPSSADECIILTHKTSRGMESAPATSQGSIVVSSERACVELAARIAQNGRVDFTKAIPMVKGTPTGPTWECTESSGIFSKSKVSCARVDDPGTLEIEYK